MIFLGIIHFRLIPPYARGKLQRKQPDRERRSRINNGNERLRLRPRPNTRLYRAILRDLSNSFRDTHDQELGSLQVRGRQPGCDGVGSPDSTCLPSPKQQYPLPATRSEGETTMLVPKCKSRSLGNSPFLTIHRPLPWMTDVGDANHDPAPATPSMIHSSITRQTGMICYTITQNGDKLSRGGDYMSRSDSGLRFGMRYRMKSPRAL